MKLENTCRCKQSLEFNDAYGKPHEFIVLREYQVDVDVSNLCDVYKVYLTGEWHPYVILSEQEFEEHFELIK